MKSLQANENIGNVIRYDIEGDFLSNPKDIAEYLNGVIQNSSDDGAHFDLARPGEKTDHLIKVVIEWLKNQGVESESTTEHKD